ncbi:MAG: AIR synthase-related protein [Nitrospirota bacterium]
MADVCIAKRIEVGFKIPDTRAEIKKRGIEAIGYKKRIEKLSLVDVYTISKDLSQEELRRSAEILSNPVIHAYSCREQACLFPTTCLFPTGMSRFDWAIEIGFLPGVTDNIGTTARETIEDLIDIRFADDEGVYYSQIIFIKGDISGKDCERIAENLSNPLIHRVCIKDCHRFIRENGMDMSVPLVSLVPHPDADIVDLDVGDEELQRIGKSGIIDCHDRAGNEVRRGPLALDLESMRVIRDYFKDKNRNPSDIELESLAQTWSEHCKHTIFSAELDEAREGLYKRYIQGATNKIREARGDKDICVSVFTDNSGAIVFDDDYLITDKVETHNSPSALDPFGGAITGIVGVNRDAIGFGKGAKPIINRYGFCFAYPEDKRKIYRERDKGDPALSPLRIMEGVIEGVRVGGNCSGIPTPQGFVCFDERYRGKPLVFVGTVGLIPRKINENPSSPPFTKGGKGGFSEEKLSHEKKAMPGDLIVMTGGRVGQDGIHGATFSSEAIDEASPVSAVQIGDPITQKKLSDAIIKEARDKEMYNSITDNGAGGLSCSVAEMARESGGCHVILDKVPVKYPGMPPWKIWISESQERMTLAVPQDKIASFLDLMERRGVEAAVIGKFNNSGRCSVEYRDKIIMDIELGFMHNGLPQKRLKGLPIKITREEPALPDSPDYNGLLHEMLSRHNIACTEFISTQYDHEVQGGSVIKPLVGKGRVNSYVTVTRPLLHSKRGIALSQGIYPSYGDIDTYYMAGAAIDTAVRNIISAGGRLEKIALLDNFCWCSSHEPERLYQLKMAAKACYDVATAYMTPFISGKDSMFNDFEGFDEQNNKVKISVPPTLLISSLGVIDDCDKCVTFDVKMPGDLIYALGLTRDEMGATEYLAMIGEKRGNNKRLIGNSVPQVDTDKGKRLYDALSMAIKKEIVASAISVTIGGIGIGLAKMAIAGRLGIETDLSLIPHEEGIMRDDIILFSESQGRIIVTIAPSQRDEFEDIMRGVDISLCGKVTDSPSFIIRGISGKEIIMRDISEMEGSYKMRFMGY